MDEVLVLRTEELGAGQKAEIVELCVAAHGNEEFRKMFLVYFVSGGRHAVVRVDGAIVSHAVVTTRWAQPDGHPPLRTAFVDAVSTHPSLEGRGFGSAAMRGLAESIGDHEIGCLQTDIAGFYERLGWEPWRGPLAGRKEGQLVPTPEQRGVMILRLPGTPPLDLDAAMSIEWQPDRFWE